jgi:hypothetical protein
MIMKTLMLITLLMATVVAKAEVRDYKVVCQKPKEFTAYWFTGEGTVSYDEAQDLSKAKPSEKNSEYHVMEGKAEAEMSFVFTTPEGTYAVDNVYSNRNEKTNLVYTIPAMALMYEKSFLVKVRGQSSQGQAGELHMLLKGPPSNGTSKVIAGGRIYWSNCQIVE